MAPSHLTDPPPPASGHSRALSEPPLPLLPLHRSPPEPSPRRPPSEPCAAHPEEGGRSSSAAASRSAVRRRGPASRACAVVHSEAGRRAFPMVGAPLRTAPPSDPRPFPGSAAAVTPGRFPVTMAAAALKVKEGAGAQPRPAAPSGPGAAGPGGGAGPRRAGSASDPVCFRLCRSEESFRGRRLPERQSYRAGPAARPSHTAGPEGAALGGRRRLGAAPHERPPAEGLSGAARPPPPPERRSPRRGLLRDFLELPPPAGSDPEPQRAVSAPGAQRAARRPGPERGAANPLHASSSSSAERLRGAVERFGFIWGRGGKRCCSGSPARGAPVRFNARR